MLKKTKSQFRINALDVPKSPITHNLTTDTTFKAL